jgi:hypothetical protein
MGKPAHTIADVEAALEKGMARLRADSHQIYNDGVRAGRQHEREMCALMVERMGEEGYGTLAIAAAIRAMG